ncbi:MAG: 2-C-methyl-D-erythritol 2,4-cyclodiphosphate synthase [Deltaproteobacteria bacterium]|nr:2-C-methyl-D-erythritol 2,4-cyclodiphosphate synthase [Deltaproteobacteria bacterium]
MFRIGFGYDTHRLVEGRDLVLGGVRIPYHLGLLGHSDADVLTHAIIDAILGALALGDIGAHFPDNDMAFKDSESLKLLEKIMEIMKREKYRINNIDSTIKAERPKIAEYIPDMKQKLSSSIDTGIDRISIKATTGEGMGFCGRGEGIEAFAVVSLIKV